MALSTMAVLILSMGVEAMSWGTGCMAAWWVTGVEEGCVAMEGGRMLGARSLSCGVAILVVAAVVTKKDCTLGSGP
jgi:hypothetical protein